MNGRGPPLTALQAFVTVAEAHSVREAARRLGVGHSVVARHLKTLQDWARCKLVETGPSGAQLTEEGHLVFAAVGPAFAAIARMGEEFRPSPDRTPLEIWCAPGLASRWLVPRLDMLSGALHNRQILVRPGEKIPDFQQGEADAAIVYGLAPPSDDLLASVELCRPLFFPVASKSWLALNAPPSTVHDLAAASLIHEHSDDQWRFWLRSTGGEEPGPLAGPRLWYASMALDAAEHGQGLALTNELLAGPALRDGKLDRVTGWGALLGSYYLVAAKRRAGDSWIAKLRAWLADQLADHDQSPSCRKGLYLDA